MSIAFTSVPLCGRSPMQWPGAVRTAGRLGARSIALRESIVDALVAGRRGHVGSALSLVEILRVLYDDILNERPADPAWSSRDRCILSKGHGCLALCAILVDKGFFSQHEFRNHCRPGALRGGHPETDIPGVEASTGALGRGLPIGVGRALAARLRDRFPCDYGAREHVVSPAGLLPTRIAGTVHNRVSPAVRPSLNNSALFSFTSRLEVVDANTDPRTL